MGNLNEDCDLMIDQIRTIDNKRLIEKVGNLPTDIIKKIKENISIIIDLESIEAT